MLETSFFQIFHGGKSAFIISFDKINFFCVHNKICSSRNNNPSDGRASVKLGVKDKECSVFDNIYYHAITTPALQSASSSFTQWRLRLLHVYIDFFLVCSKTQFAKGWLHFLKVNQGANSMDAFTDIVVNEIEPKFDADAFVFGHIPALTVVFQIMTCSQLRWATNRTSTPLPVRSCPVQCESIKRV